MHTKNSFSAATEYVPEVCPNCNGTEFDVQSRDQHFLYGKPEEAVELVATVPVHNCKTCGFEFTGEEAEESRQEAVCRHLGILSPRQILQLRKKYGMSRSQFAELSGIGSASLARWELGTLTQNLANDQLLYLLHFEENVGRLQGRSAKKNEESKGTDASLKNRLSALNMECEERTANPAIGGMFCRRSIKGSFRAIHDLGQRRSVAQVWSLRGRVQ